MNNVGTMIGVNGGPIPEDNSTSSAGSALNLGPNSQLNKVYTGNGGDWYPKTEKPNPPVYHKYFKGAKKEGEDAETPDVEETTGSTTEQEPTSAPASYSAKSKSVSSTPKSNTSGSYSSDSENSTDKESSYEF